MSASSGDSRDLESLGKVRRFHGRTLSYYPERASALSLKDTAAPRFGHSDVVFCYSERCFKWDDDEGSLRNLS